MTDHVPLNVSNMSHASHHVQQPVHVCVCVCVCVCELYVWPNNLAIYSLVVHLSSISTETLGTTHSNIVFKLHGGTVAIETHHVADNLLVLMYCM